MALVNIAGTLVDAVDVVAVFVSGTGSIVWLNDGSFIEDAQPAAVNAALINATETVPLLTTPIVVETFPSPAYLAGAQVVRVASIRSGTASVWSMRSGIGPIICPTTPIGTAQTLIAATGGGGGGGGGDGVPSFRFVVGNAAAGDTAADCDYLDPGDGTGIVSALAAATLAGVGEVYLRGGVYDFGAGVAALPLAVPPGLTIRGAGNGAVLEGDQSDIVPGGTTLIAGAQRQIMALPVQSTIRDLSVRVAPVGPGLATGTAVLAGAGPFTLLRLRDVAFVLPVATEPTETLEHVLWAPQGELDWTHGGIDGDFANGADGGVELVALGDFQLRLFDLKLGGVDRVWTGNRVQAIGCRVRCIEGFEGRAGTISGCRFDATGMGGFFVRIGAMSTGFQLVGNDCNDSMARNAISVDVRGTNATLTGNRIIGGVIGLNIAATAGSTALVGNLAAGTTAYVDAGTFTIIAGNNF